MIPRNHVVAFVLLLMVNAALPAMCDVQPPPKPGEPEVILSGTWGTEPGQFGRTHPDELPLGPTTFNIDRYGGIYVVDYMNSRIQQFTGEGSLVAVFAMSHGTWVDHVASPWDAIIRDGKLQKENVPVFVAASGNRIGELVDGKIKWRDTRLSGGAIRMLWVDRRNWLFAEQQGVYDKLPIANIYGPKLGYMGHRPIHDVCLDPSGELLGVAATEESKETHLRKLTVQWYADGDYWPWRRVELQVEASKGQDVRLIGADLRERLYVLVLDSVSDHEQSRVIRFERDGKKLGTVPLRDVWRGNMDVAGWRNQIKVGISGEVYAASTRPEEGYRILRIKWPE